MNHRRFGPSGVQSYEPWWERGGERLGPSSDDTQMAAG
jgi:hypothetical protein